MQYGENTTSILRLLFLVSLLGAAPNVWAAGVTGDCAPVQQLRIYEVPDENIQVFHERFRDHAAPIMARYGFEILAMWESHFEGRTEFVYLLTWPDVATMEAQWAKFMADEEWDAIKARTGAAHGTFVNNIEDRTLCPTNYSPGRIG